MARQMKQKGGDAARSALRGIAGDDDGTADYLGRRKSGPGPGNRSSRLKPSADSRRGGETLRSRSMGKRKPQHLPRAAGVGRRAQDAENFVPSPGSPPLRREAAGQEADRVFSRIPAPRRIRGAAPKRREGQVVVHGASDRGGRSSGRAPHSKRQIGEQRTRDRQGLRLAKRRKRAA